MFSIFVGFTGLKSESWPDIQLAGSQLLANPTPCKRTLFKMDLASFPPFQDATILTEEKNLYKWLLQFIQEKNYGSDSVTLVSVKQLRDLVHLKTSRHSSCPKDMLTNRQFCHLIAYMVCKMKFDEVSSDVQKGMIKKLPNFGKEFNHNDLWESGIKFIRKKAGVSDRTIG